MDYRPAREVVPGLRGSHLVLIIDSSGLRKVFRQHSPVINYYKLS